MALPRAPTSCMRFQRFCNTAKWGFFYWGIMFENQQSMTMMRTVVFFLIAFFSRGWAAAQLPDVTEKALSDLGSTYGLPQMNGFVFIDGRYIPPPYTVTRKGNAIFINRIQVEQPVPWPRPELVPSADAEPAKKAGDADGDFEPVTAAARAPAPQGAAAEAPAAAETSAKAKAVKSIDDLFADDDAPVKAASAAQTSVAAEVPEAKASGKVSPQAETETGSASEASEREKKVLIANLERLRKGYEQSLSRGDMFFFGQRHNRLNGNYGTARTLMKVLPKALRNADSPNDLWQRLTQGGVYFIDMGICAELYRNKLTFPQLEERQRKIEEAEAFEAMRRKPVSVW